MDVFHPNDSFHFDKLQLTPPQHITGGSYMTRFSYCESKQPLYIQTTKTLSKQGIVISGKKAHIDLLLSSNDADTDFIEWITSLEKRTVDLLYEKRHIWFTQELDHTDIENSLTSPIRAYKTGNYLLRVNLEPSRHATAHVQPFLCKVFDEHKKIAPVEYIKAEHSIISIIEFQGIKFTSRNFQIELLLRQVLVIPDIPLFETCIIRADSQSQPIQTPTPTPIPTQPQQSPISVPQETTIKQTTIKEAEISNDYLGLLPNKEPEKEVEIELEVDSERQRHIVDDYIASRPPLKHFECMEVDIDFKNIPDTIDVNEPSFEVSNDATTTTNTTQEKKQERQPTAQSKPITLKKHKDVLYEMYKVAKHKANEMKRAAMRAYLEAKEIKAKYLLDDLDDLHSNSSDDDSKI